jgi:hypothetical protein
MENEWVTILDSTSISRVRVFESDLDVEYKTTGEVYRFFGAAGELKNIMDVQGRGKSVGSYINVVMKPKFPDPKKLSFTEGK